MSRAAALRASTAGGRSGMFATSGEQAHAPGPGGDVRQKCPGVEESRLVAVVLEADEVEAEPVGEFGHRQDLLVLAGVRRQGRTEDQLMPAIAHRREPSRSPRCSRINE